MGFVQTDAPTLAALASSAEDTLLRTTHYLDPQPCSKRHDASDRYSKVQSSYFLSLLCNVFCHRDYLNKQI